MSTLERVFAEFNPIVPLRPGDPRYVDTIAERGVPTLLSDLLLPLEEPGSRCVMFSGHVGDGKTTIVRQLQALLEENGAFVVFGEADQRLDLSDVDYDDVLLTILGLIDEGLRQRYGGTLEIGRFRQFWADLGAILQQDVQLTKADISLGPLGKLTAEMRDTPAARQEVRRLLRQARGPTFLEVVNEYVGRAQDFIRERGHRQLVVILDNLDRVPETRVAGVWLDESLFIGQATQLARVGCSVVYTVRLALAHSRADDFNERYGSYPVIVPMIPVRRRDGSSHAEGLAKLVEIVRLRLEAADTDTQGAFGDESLVRRLCEASGGHLRQLMTLVRSSCSQARARRAGLPMTGADVEGSIRQVGAERRRVAHDYQEALNRVGEAHSLVSLAPDIRQKLLDSRLVYEYYDGDYWYDVAPVLRRRDDRGS